MVKKITVKTNPKLYAKWARLKRRCSNVKCGEYKYYGGLGISVCPEWDRYENFYYWALDSGYSDKLCLTRKDKSKDFSPDNCKWVDNKEIGSNKTNNHHITCPKTGRIQTMTEWARELNLSIGTLSSRLKVVSIERALTPGPLSPRRLNQRVIKPSKLKSVWYGMINRCFNVKYRKRAYYKDVTVCDSWLEYSNFEKWAYENGYQENLMLGRNNTSKDFCPENCRWTTRQEINKNIKSNVKIYHDGEVLCQSDLAKQLEISRSTMHHRLNSNATTSEKLFCKGRQYKAKIS